MPSTVIRRHVYDAEAECLAIEFVTGRRYLYSGVPAATYDAFRRAMSKGGFFNRRIRDRFPFRELTDA